MNIIFVSISGLICIFCIICRAVICGDKKSNPRFTMLLLISLTGNIFAFFGFKLLIEQSPKVGIDYSNILLILSLLATGIITGNYTFTYQDSRTKDSIFPNVISIFFTILFYFLFGAISYYMGKSESISSIESVSLIIPIIMTLVIITNILFDYWDYLNEEKGE